jgi:NTP pyrophosphatase (non-canonical NTP hydrolase)
MNDKEYMEAAARTVSRGFHLGDVTEAYTVNINELITRLKWVAAKNTELDLVKKSLFYGKPYNPPKKGAGWPIMEADNPDHVFDLGNINPNMLHALIGLATETGELLEAVIKAARNGTDLDRVNVFEELGDVEWYLALAYTQLKTTAGAVRAANIAKLKARYPEKFTQECALDRDVDQEIEVLKEHLAI